MIGAVLSAVVTLAMLVPLSMAVMGDNFLDEHGKEMVYLTIIGIASIRADVIYMHIQQQLTKILESEAVRHINGRYRKFRDQAHRNEGNMTPLQIQAWYDYKLGKIDERQLCKILE